MKKADIGMIGLAVMGQSLILNMESKGFTVACYDLNPEQSVKGFVEGRGAGKNLIGAYSLEEFFSGERRKGKGGQLPGSWQGRKEAGGEETSAGRL